MSGIGLALIISNARYAIISGNTDHMLTPGR